MALVFAPSQIETWPLERLRPYARNAKIHGTDQVAKIAASMAKFGWTVPCMVADDGELIAGHGRVLAAAMLGLKDVPVIRLSHLDEAGRRAYRIADNKLTELGEWDEAMLRDEIAGLLAALTGRIEVRFSDSTLVTQAIDGTSCELEFVYSLGANASFTFTAHAVYLPIPRIEIAGPQGVQASFDWQAAKAASPARMCTAVLVNNVATY